MIVIKYCPDLKMTNLYYMLFLDVCLKLNYST